MKTEVIQKLIRDANNYNDLLNRLGLELCEIRKYYGEESIQHKCLVEVIFSILADVSPKVNVVKEEAKEKKLPVATFSKCNDQIINLPYYVDYIKRIANRQTIIFKNGFKFIAKLDKNENVKEFVKKAKEEAKKNKPKAIFLKGSMK